MSERRGGMEGLLSGRGKKITKQLINCLFMERCCGSGRTFSGQTLATRQNDKKQH